MCALHNGAASLFVLNARMPFIGFCATIITLVGQLAGHTKCSCVMNTADEKTSVLQPAANCPLGE